MTNPTEINSRITLIRKELKLTQTEFGEALGVSRDVIKNLEYNRVEPKALFLDHLCKVYNVNPNWLETGEGEMFREKTEYEALAEFFGDVLNDQPESFRITFLSALAALDDDGWSLLEAECKLKAEIYDKQKKKDSE